MKPHFKTIATTLALAVLGGCMPALAAVPLRWNVETSRAQPASFDAYHGETLELCADMFNYGKPLALSGNAQLFYQTNSMAGWWTAPATISSNRIEATFSPSMDPGASQLYCFLGVTGSIYRAAFRLRLLNAPGAEPGNLPLPPLAIDFARVTTENAPWIPKVGGMVEEIRVTDKIYFGNPPSSGGQGFANKYLAIGGYGSFVTKSPEGRTVRILDEYNFPDVFGELYGEDLATLAGMVTEHDGSLSVLASTVSALSTTQAQDHATIAAWQTYWDGDDVRVTVTNYYGSLDIPSLYLEQRMPADGDHSEPWFRTVWDERTRWEDFLATNNLWKADVAESLGQKADRAWGHYDSHTGGWSPDGYTQVSSSNILIAAGMAYQRHVVTEGAVWLLESNGLVTNLGGNADSGFFKIQDDDGNAMFEIVKGNRREVGATANSLTSEVVNGVTHLTVTYNVVSAEHPKLYTTHDLGQTFIAEDDASSPVVTSWTGSSGTWVCEFHYKASVADKSRLFAKAGYTTGGETMIRQSVPVEMGSIILNDTKYYLGTATISGHTVLTLRTTP